mgnify:CR=1 FL=1
MSGIDRPVGLVLVLPLLFGAEFVLHQRVGRAVQKFTERELIPDSEQPKVDAIIATARRWLDSVWVDLLLVVLVYTIGVNGVWRHVSALEIETWYDFFDNGVRKPSAAGWWLGHRFL